MLRIKNQKSKKKKTKKKKRKAQRSEREAKEFSRRSLRNQFLLSCSSLVPLLLRFHRIPINLDFDSFSDNHFLVFSSFQGTY